MALERVFLGWDRPCLTRAAQYLIERYGQSESIRMESATLVVPGGRAGRRLLEILILEAEALKKIFLPPRIVTAGELPEVLVHPQNPRASEIQRILAWVTALKKHGTTELKRIVPTPPEQNNLAAWWALAKQVQILSREISGAALNFGDVAQRCRELPYFVDDERWEALQALYGSYLASLAEVGRVDQYQARLDAIKSKNYRTSGDVILVSTSDLLPITRQMLLQLDVSVIALVHAPEDLGHMFDELGCLIGKQWLTQEIPVEDSQLHIVNNAEDQAGAVSQIIASFDARYSINEITVGAGDKDLVPHISEALAERDVLARDAVGVLARITRPLTFLEAVTRYLSSRRFVDFASLIRHPDVLNWLNRETEIGSESVAIIDRYQSDHLQDLLTEKLPGDEPTKEKVLSLYRAIELLLGDLNSAPRALHEWGDIVVQLLLRIYGQTALNPKKTDERIIIEACELIKEWLLEAAQIPFELGERCSADKFLHLLLEEVGNSYITPEPLRDAIELLGWLELQLDDSPALIIAGFNEGYIPESVNDDPFLPNSLRHHLGLLDNDQRYARDAFALSAILHSKNEVHLIAGRRKESGPLILSRLLFACDDQRLAERVLLFYGNDETTPKIYNDGLLKSAKELDSFAIPPKPEALKKHIEYMSVTSFADYMQCPYRYYLKHVLKLRELNDEMLEMDGLSFGSLAHEVFRQFGESTLVGSSDEAKLTRYLHEQLDSVFEKRFGRNALPAVLVQYHQLEMRMSNFAKWQSQWREAGWEIRHVEIEIIPEQVKLKLGDELIGLHGKIDRVDWNPITREWAVLDYKTGDRSKSWSSCYSKKKGWLDLQLPLYRYMLRQRGIIGTADRVRLGYLNVCSSSSAVKEDFATWTEEELGLAEVCACQIAKDVRAQKFWPPADVRAEYDSFALICGNGRA